MPVHRGRDSLGPYYQWGNAHKYRYIAGNSQSRTRAYNLALAQARAIYANRKSSV